MNSKIKKLISLILFILAVLLFVIAILLNTQKQNKNIDDKKPILSKYEMSNLIKDYILKIENLNDYAQKNNQKKITINEFKSIFNIDISEIKKYDCDFDNTYIIFNDTFDYFNISYDCSFITPSLPE